MAGKLEFSDSFGLWVICLCDALSVDSRCSKMPSMAVLLPADSIMLLTFSVHRCHELNLGVLRASPTSTWCVAWITSFISTPYV